MRESDYDEKRGMSEWVNEKKKVEILLENLTARIVLAPTHEKGRSASILG